MVSPIRLFDYADGTWVSGLGAMHAQEGFPLELSFDQCAIRGWTPCFYSTELELIKCGVDGESAKGVVLGGIAGMIEPVPECWGDAVRRYMASS